MLMTFFASAVIIGLLFAGMAIGVILANKPVKGSCGGMSAVGLDGACDVCGRNPADCENPDQQDETAQRKRAAALSRNALD